MAPLTKSIRTCIIMTAILFATPDADAAQCRCKPAPRDAAQSVSADVAAMNKEGVDYVNSIRAQRGLAPVKYDALIASVAMRHSQWMTDNNKDTTHNKELEWLLDSGRSMSGQSGVYSVDNITVKQAIDAWLNSPSHAGLIVGDKNTDIGIGHVGNDWTIISIP
ncbi:MAG: CAP domain-containing protein [Rickettsiales bacterium]